MVDRQRLVDKSRAPSPAEIRAAVGNAWPLWVELGSYLAAVYGFPPELVFYGADYGWTVRYRKSGRTLCCLFPEQGGFTALVVLGAAEAEKALALATGLGPEARRVLTATPALRDGRWLWIPVTHSAVVDDVKKLLAIKRRPRRPAGGPPRVRE